MLQGTHYGHEHNLPLNTLFIITKAFSDLVRANLHSDSTVSQNKDITESPLRPPLVTK